MIPVFIWYIQVFIMGTVCGSFAKVCIDRLPEGRSLWTRSACSHCATPISPRDLIPIANWLWLRGKCRQCSTSIPLAIPLVELFGGLLACLIWRRFVPGVPDLPHLSAWAVYFALSMTLAIGAFVDIRHRILPDEVTIYAVPFMILAAGGLHAIGFHDWPDPSFKRAILGAGLNGIFFGAFALIAAFIARREALGWGDVKLVTLIGAVTGPSIWPILFGAWLGAFSGIIFLVIRRKSSTLPFGPSLVFSAWFYLLFGKEFLTRWFPGLYQATKQFFG